MLLESLVVILEMSEISASSRSIQLIFRLAGSRVRASLPDLHRGKQSSARALSKSHQCVRPSPRLTASATSVARLVPFVSRWERYTDVPDIAICPRLIFIFFILTYSKSFPGKLRKSTFATLPKRKTPAVSLS